MGIDCGQTLTKVSVFNEKADEVCSFSEKSGVYSDMKEQEELWETVLTLIKCASDFIGGERLASISVSGHGNGVYFLSDDSKKNRYAVLSTFSKTGESFFYLDRERIFDITCQRPWSGQMLPILGYLKESDCESFNHIKKIMFCKDYINYRLTGNVYTDYGDATVGGILNCRTKGYDFELLSLYGLEECGKLLPEVKTSKSICGNLLPSVAEKTGLSADTRVYIGCCDVQACTLGAGVSDDEYSSVAGTWTICGGFSSNIVRSKDLFECTVWCDGEKYFNIESSPSSAVNLEWYKSTIKNVSHEESERITSEYSPGAVNMLFLPFAKGIPKSGKVFQGFVGDGDENKKLRAVFEGIAFAHRYHIEELKKSGIIKESVRLSGGISNSNEWCKILSDTLNMPVRVSKNKNCGALGAAFCMRPELIPNETEKVFYPEKNNVYIYNNKYKQFQKYL